MEKTKLNNQKKELEQKLNKSEEKRSIKTEKKDLDVLIKSFLKLEKIEKIYLYRLINKIEIDKDKNIYIYFNFSNLNLIIENSANFIKIEEIINYQNPTVV